jgi:hypothetical protein
VLRAEFRYRNGDASLLWRHEDDRRDVRLAHEVFADGVDAVLCWWLGWSRWIVWQLTDVDSLCFLGLDVGVVVDVEALADVVLAE